MGLWKDRIDTEIGSVSWNKRGVYEKLSKQKRKPTFLKIPFVLAAVAAVVFILITTNQTSQTSEQTTASLMESIEDSNLQAYYYSTFKSKRGNFYAGKDNSYIGTKKGYKVEEMQAMLSNLTVSEFQHELYGLEDVKEVVVHFDNGSTYKLRVSYYILYDVENDITYDISNLKYYTIFQGELDPLITVFRWINGIFLSLIGINLLFAYLNKKPFREKFHALSSLNISLLFVLWNAVDLLIGYLTKNVMLTGFIVITVIHLLLIYRLRLKGQEKRFEFYKIAIYIAVMIFVWNKFFY